MTRHDSTRGGEEESEGDGARERASEMRAFTSALPAARAVPLQDLVHAGVRVRRASVLHHDHERCEMPDIKGRRGRGKFAFSRSHALKRRLPNCHHSSARRSGITGNN